MVVGLVTYVPVYLYVPLHSHPLMWTVYQHRIDKRSKYSRRREFQHDADVDYINERNMMFNRKTARFYDKYTAEIKQNLERGTAI